MLEIHDLFETFFVNMFFITFPLFLNLVILKKMSATARKLCTFIGGAILVVLIMSFPLSVFGYSFDLSIIPLIIGFLYSGYYVGFGIYLLIISSRILFGATDVSGALFVDTMTFIVLFYIEPHFKKLNISKRLFGLIPLNIFVAFLTIYSFTINQHFTSQLIYVGITNFFFQTFALLILIIFIEKIMEQAKLRERLNQAEKLEVVSQLAASISHEVRNPLTVSMGFLQLLNDEHLPDDKKRNFIKLALEEMSRANQIITGYLAFAKPTMELPEYIDVNQEIRKIVDIITPYANMQSVEIDTRLIEDIFVIGERQKVQQCLINLAKNSIEAMPNGGYLSIEMSVDKDLAKITISDTGIGMSKEEIKRIGQPYFSTKEKGTGLGMMVVYGIIKSMAGSIEVDSKKLQGTKIIISLPIQQKVQS